MPTAFAGNQTEAVDYNVAMRRLVYVVAVGCLLISIYGIHEASTGSLAVGLMTAGAALLAGGLLGFLFGVPHTREEGVTERGDTSETSSSEPAGDGTTLSDTYRPSTSLEQISDWLTKILVGVGLVDIRDILAKILKMAEYIAPALSKAGSTDQGARVFALAIIVYFSVCGFVFGFLWARLYLPRWFAEADRVRRLLSQLEQQQQNDANAMALCYRLLTPTQEGARISDSQVTEAMKKASRAVKTQIFSQAEIASEDEANPDHEARLKGAISIFKGLIADDKEEKYHRNYSELSYASSRMKPPDWAAAEKAIDKAIEIRKKLRVKGWRYYEFRRARSRIERDPKFEADQESDSEVVAKIRADLVLAASHERWKSWLGQGGAIVDRWMKRNNVTVP